MTDYEGFSLTYFKNCEMFVEKGVKGTKVKMWAMNLVGVFVSLWEKWYL